MFVSDYLEFKSKARKEIKDVVFKAIEIYKVLEDKKINYYSYSMEKSMDIVDKYSFATLIAILDSDKKLNNYFKRYDITIEKIIDYLDIDLTDVLKLYPDQLESEFIHGYGSFLQKITNTYEWNQIDIINLVDNVIYEYRDDSDAMKSFFKDNKISISDVSKGLLNLDEEDFLEDIKFFGYANFDFKYDERTKEYIIFEINIRQGRSSSFTTLSGYNITKYLVDDVIYNKKKKIEYLTDKHLWNVVGKHTILKHWRNWKKNR